MKHYLRHMYLKGQKSIKEHCLPKKPHMIHSVVRNTGTPVTLISTQVILTLLHCTLQPCYTALLQMSYKSKVTINLSGNYWQPIHHHLYCSVVYCFATIALFYCSMCVYIYNYLGKSLSEFSVVLTRGLCTY